VRCKEGISHNPAESVENEDVGAAIGVMRGFLSLVTRRVDAEPDLRRTQGDNT
jgi:hypothetical protein